MNLGIYGLFRPTPASAQEAAKNYGDLFLQSMSQEVILSRFFLSTRDDGYNPRSEEHTSELQSQSNLVCRLLLEKKKKSPITTHIPLRYDLPHVEQHCSFRRD